MNEYLIIFLVAACIAGLMADFFTIIVKLHLFRTKIMAKEYASVNLKGNLWLVGILTFIIALYFIIF